MDTLDEKDHEVLDRLIEQHKKKAERTHSKKIEKSEREKLAFLRKIKKSEKSDKDTPEESLA